MNFVKDKPYEGCVWLRAEKPIDVYIALENADGSQIYAETRSKVKAGDWQKLDFTLKPDSSDPKGQFAIKLKSHGSIVVGYAFLQPGKWGRFKSLPVRKDLAEGFINQGITVLRYGGGMANSEQYRWKKMIGPRDKRPPYTGSFNLFSSNGWGIIDFINFCEAAGFLGIPTFNMGETPQDMADFIDYANSPVESEWGQKRAQDGHPKPYKLKYIQLGNEEAINDRYWQRFKPLAEAIWAKDPNVVLVVGDYSPDLTYKMPLTIYKNILDLAREHNREVWFDIHLGTEDPDKVNEQTILIPSFVKGLKEVSPGARFKVVVFEFNAYTHNFRRALGNAHCINELERIGDDVLIACSANALQPDGQNDDGWDQGLLFFTPTQTWGQPSYYVTQMISENHLPNCVKTDVNSPDNVLDVTAKVSDNRKTMVIQVVNPSDKSIHAEIDLKGFVPTKPKAELTELTGQFDDVNTEKCPNNIVPKRSNWKHGLNKGKINYTFPPRSFIIIKFR
jgi:alpha-L-arabinofuranosidase